MPSLRELVCSKCSRTFLVERRVGCPPKRCAQCMAPLPVGSGVSHIARDGHLPVTCWCEATIVYVPSDEVRAGRTRACSRRACKQMAAA